MARRQARAQEGGDFHRGSQLGSFSFGYLVNRWLNFLPPAQQARAPVAVGRVAVRGGTRSEY